MNPHWNSYLNRRLSRRELLRVSSTGFGSLALAALLADEAQAATVGSHAPSPLAVKPPHFAPKAKRVIFLFMHGGPSQVDTFDYKPLADSRSRQAAAVQAPESSFERDLQSAEVAVGIQATRPERNVGQRTVSRVVAAGGRHLLHQVDVGLQLPARRRAARIAHRQRYFRPAQHGFVDHLRTGHRESEHAGLYHHLPDAEPRRREQLQLRISAGSVRGHADRVGGNRGPRCEDSVHCEHGDAARRAAHGTGLPAGVESRATGGNRPGSGARGPHRILRAGLSACSRKRRDCRTSPANRPPP